jgi:hypothetical protein
MEIAGISGGDRVRDEDLTEIGGKRSCSASQSAIARQRRKRFAAREVHRSGIIDDLV